MELFIVPLKLQRWFFCDVSSWKERFLLAPGKKTLCFDGWVFGGNKNSVEIKCRQLFWCGFGFFENNNSLPNYHRLTAGVFSWFGSKYVKNGKNGEIYS